MKKTVQKLPGNLLLVGIFLLFMGLFSYFRSEIAHYAASLLAMTNEITLSKAQVGSPESIPSIKIVTDKKIQASKKKNLRKVAVRKRKQLDNRFKKPVTAKLPKTRTPIILFDDDFPDWDDYRLKLFPSLRKYDGTVWREEKTQVKASTDGKKLYMICRLYDQVPEEAVTKNAKKNGDLAWKDDGLEIFFMKNKKSKFYCQYIVSVSARGTVRYMNNTKAPNQGVIKKNPKNFAKPRFRSSEFDGGFEIEIVISLNNIGIKEIKSGDSFLMQIVRNYRGQGYKNSVTLHLFPSYIYGDKRFGVNNHDRRAFQKVIVRKD